MREPLNKTATLVAAKLEEYLKKEQVLQIDANQQKYTCCPECGGTAQLCGNTWGCKVCDSQGDVIAYAKRRYHHSSDEKALQEVCRTLNVNFPVLLTTTARDLLTADLPEKEMVVEDVLTPGLYIMAGAPKIGKSLVALQMAISISTGQPLWNHQTKKSGVLYLALEDNEHLIQNRLRLMTTGINEIGDIDIALEAPLLGNGLEEYLGAFLQKKPNVKVVIIDTLGRAKGKSDDRYNYFADYAMMSAFKKIASRFSVAILLVHHTRKQASNDVMAMISGTNGLFGAVDGAMLMLRPNRQKDLASIDICGKNFRDSRLVLMHDKKTLRWELSDKTASEEDNMVIQAILELMKENKKWEGTATELLAELMMINSQIQTEPNVLIRRINGVTDTLEKQSVIFKNGRNGNEKIKSLERITDK